MIESNGLRVFSRSPGLSRRLALAGGVWLLVTAAAGRSLPIPGLVLLLSFAGAAACLALGLRGLAGRTLFTTLRLNGLERPAMLGEALSLELAGQAAEPVSLRRLVLHLRCHERALWRSGSREVLFVKKVYEKSLVLAENHPLQPGTSTAWTAKLKVPADRAPSFVSGDHSVGWELVLEAEASGWPVASRSWELAVLPVVAA